MDTPLAHREMMEKLSAAAPSLPQDASASLADMKAKAVELKDQASSRRAENNREAEPAAN